MTEPPIDRAIRAAFASRDPGPAPAGLALRIRESRAAERGPIRVASTRFARALTGVAVLATAAAVLAIALTVTRDPAVGPGASPAPATLYAIQPGDGVVRGEYLPVFQALVCALVLGALVAIGARNSDRRVRIPAAVATLGILLVATSIGKSDALEFASGGYGVQPGRAAPEGEPGMYVAVTGNSQYVLLLTVTNTSRLPLEIIGVPSDEPASPHLPRFVGLGLLPDNVIDGSATLPFHPKTLAPDEFANLTFLGLAGDCATSSPGPEGQAGYSIDRVGIVYEQLTLRHYESLELPEPVVITTHINGSCT